MLRNLEVNKTVQASWTQHFLTLITEPLPHTPRWGDSLGNIGPDGCKILSEVMLLWPRESFFLCGKEQVWRCYVFRLWLMGERSSPPHEGAVWLMIGWTGVQCVLSSISISSHGPSVSWREGNIYRHCLPFIQAEKEATIQRHFISKLGNLKLQGSSQHNPCLCEGWEWLGATECSRWRGEAERSQ